MLVKAANFPVVTKDLYREVLDCFRSISRVSAYLCFKPSEFIQRLLGCIPLTRLPVHTVTLSHKAPHTMLCPIACSSAWQKRATECNCDSIHSGLCTMCIHARHLLLFRLSPTADGYACLGSSLHTRLIWWRETFTFSPQLRLSGAAHLWSRCDKLGMLLYAAHLRHWPH